MEMRSQRLLRLICAFEDSEVLQYKTDTYLSELSRCCTFSKENALGNVQRNFPQVLAQCAATLVSKIVSPENFGVKAYGGESV